MFHDALLSQWLCLAIKWRDGLVTVLCGFHVNLTLVKKTWCSKHSTCRNWNSPASLPQHMARFSSKAHWAFCWNGICVPGLSYPWPPYNRCSSQRKCNLSNIVIVWNAGPPNPSRRASACMSLACKVGRLSEWYRQSLVWAEFPSITIRPYGARHGQQNWWLHCVPVPALVWWCRESCPSSIHVIWSQPPLFSTFRPQLGPGHSFTCEAIMLADATSSARWCFIRFWNRSQVSSSCHGLSHTTQALAPQSWHVEIGPSAPLEWTCPDWQSDAMHQRNSVMVPRSALVASSSYLERASD